MEKNKICICTTFDRNYIEAGKTLFSSIKRHTDCTGIDFKVITSDDNMQPDKDATEEDNKEANKNYAEELHNELKRKVKYFIEQIINEDELLEETFVEGYDNWRKDYGIKIKVSS